VRLLGVGVHNFATFSEDGSVDTLPFDDAPRQS
jgi:hypothetical protein